MRAPPAFYEKYVSAEILHFIDIARHIIIIRYIGIYTQSRQAVTEMTFAQFRRMKPKYKRRLMISIVVALGLFIGLLYALSFGIAMLRVQLNTTKLDKITASNVLDKTGMNSILETLKQEDGANILVSDSAVRMDYNSKITDVTMNLVNVVDKSTAEYWLLTATSKKATLRKVETKYDSPNNALGLRKVPLKSYYPALSRITTTNLRQFLKETAPVGKGGYYTFTDDFDDNLHPEFSSYIEGGMTGIWVSNTGAVTPEIASNFTPTNECAPTVISIEAVDKELSKGKKIVLADPVKKFVVLFEAGPY